MDKEELNALLLWAAEAGNVAKTQAALDAGADINTKRDSGNTPLHLAVNRGRLDTVKLLLEKGADVNAKADERFTPLHIAAMNKRIYADIVDLLERAAAKQQGHAARVTGERKDKGPPQVGG